MNCKAQSVSIPLFPILISSVFGFISTVALKKTTKDQKGNRLKKFKNLYCALIWAELMCTIRNWSNFLK